MTTPALTSPHPHLRRGEAPEVGACTEVCWAPVSCPTHHADMPPRDRSSGQVVCCENWGMPELNTRHLFDGCDAMRVFAEEYGRERHESSCEDCGGWDDDED